MRRLIAILCISVFAISCSSSNRCGCPSFGDIQEFEGSELNCQVPASDKKYTEEDLTWL